MSAMFATSCLPCFLVNTRWVSVLGATAAAERSRGAAAAWVAGRRSQHPAAANHTCEAATPWRARVASHLLPLVVTHCSFCTCDRSCCMFRGQPVLRARLTPSLLPLAINCSFCMFRDQPVLDGGYGVSWDQLW